MVFILAVKHADPKGLETLRLVKSFKVREGGGQSVTSVIGSNLVLCPNQRKATFETFAHLISMIVGVVSSASPVTDTLSP